MTGEEISLAYHEKTILLLILLASSAPVQAQILPEVPDGAQALSLAGTPLFAPEADSKHLENLATAKAD